MNFDHTKLLIIHESIVATDGKIGPSPASEGVLRRKRLTCEGFPTPVQGHPAPARLKDAARRSRGRPGRPVLDPRRVGRPGLGVSGARGAPTGGRFVRLSGVPHHAARGPLMGPLQ